ncbi:cation-transporting P-type ATPase [Candidatus Peregrinibacteria bacterium]|nr:cation-transporting P-type ATPase [Candidatus Peregrinibacteria bacterium]
MTFAYQLTAGEVLKRYKTTPDGIDQKEAELRQTIYGKNRLEISQKNTLLISFLAQFTDLMVVLLIIAGIISLFLNNTRDAMVFFAIVIINIIVGFIQEYKAEKMLDSLKNLVKAKAKVTRNGKLIEISAEEIVPGDIITLEAGDRVPADMRIIEENGLGANDFSLTGESNPVKKFVHPIDHEVALGDRNNLFFTGTTVAMGNGKGVVIAIGMRTEIGRIAHLSHETPDDISPLQKQLNHVAKKLMIIAGGVTLLIVASGMAREFSWKTALIFALPIAASIVPQALPAQISVALSLSAGRLARKKAVIKKLSAVETLGSTHIICTDKTGTLTKNEMTVQEILLGEKKYSITGVGYEPIGDILDAEGQKLSSQEELGPLFLTAVLASNAEVSPPDKEHLTWYAIGDPTEAALITMTEKAGLHQKKLNETYHELREFSFDAGRKMMSSVRDMGNGHIQAYVKGAPLIILKHCTHYLDGNTVKPMTPEYKKFVTEEDEKYASQAYRMLACSYRDLDNFHEKMPMSEVEQNLIWIGMVAMIDPPRDEVKAAISAAKQALIRVIIITGDYALTAKAIAQKIGLGNEKNIEVVTNEELARMSDVALLKNLIQENIIFSRTTPEDKLRIVNLLKKAGDIVAVTGDGINDAPALKRADIGVAMGKTGTDVAQESSEIVLMDDSFATLVDAIREGRIIYANLKKTIIGNLMACMGELVIVLISITFSFLFDIPLGILAIQILAIDMGGEFLPLTALTFDPGEKDIMKEPPRSPIDYILNKKRLMDIAWSSLLMGGLAYANFLLFAVREGFSWKGFSDLTSPLYAQAVTLTYVTIVLIQLGNIVSLRTKENMFSKYLMSNKRLIGAYLLSGILILNVSYNPYISKFLQTGPLNRMDWLMAFSAMFLFVFIREMYKKTVTLSLSKGDSTNSL